jgi:hypothetical protein
LPASTATRFPELRSLAKEFGLGGVILFARNVAEPEQVAELPSSARLVPDLPSGSRSIRKAAASRG